MVDKIDSNATGLAFAEEVIGYPKYILGDTLPDGAGNAGTPIWYAREPNSFKDFGGDFKNVARAPINKARQKQKGTLTDLDASGGFNEDVTQNNLQRLMQGFMFASMRQKPATLPLNGTQRAMSSVTASTKVYAHASGSPGFISKNIVLASGFGVAANNGIKVATAAGSGSVTVAEVIADEASPPATAKLEAVGVQFASGDAVLDYTAPVLGLSTTAFDLTTLGLIAGEWVFLGGDGAGLKFAEVDCGYARVGVAPTTHLIVFDKTTFAPADGAGTSKTVQMFFGNVLRNEDNPTNIVARSYQLERQLGNGGGGTQSELLLGSFANMLDFNIPKADKLNADLSFMSMDYAVRSGATGVKGGTRVSALGEQAFNTSKAVYRMRIALVDPATLNPTALFGYVTDGKVSINNNLSVDKAVGVLGGFDVTSGDFEVTGNVNAYFTTVSAADAVRSYSDVTIDFILARANAAIVFDMPLVGLGGGRINVVKDQPVMIPLDTPAYEGANGFTLLANFFPYIPTAGMPT